MYNEATNAKFILNDLKNCERIKRVNWQSRISNKMHIRSER